MIKAVLIIDIYIYLYFNQNNLDILSQKFINLKKLNLNSLN
jgi:hypothetical protein